LLLGCRVIVVAASAPVRCCYQDKAIGRLARKIVMAEEKKRRRGK